MIDKFKEEDVHCRIGSLETTHTHQELLLIVHCRIGSLEKYPNNTRSHYRVHCRIGSLEITL